MDAHQRPGVVVTHENHGEGGGVLTPHLRIAHEAYVALIDELIVRVLDGGVRPNQVVAVMTGGFLPAWAVSQALNIPIAFFAAESYVAAVGGDRRKMRAADGIQFRREILQSQPGFGTHILVVDDLTDSGRTLKTCIEWLRESPRYGAGLKTIRTAVLWHKPSSVFAPDVLIDTVPPIASPGNAHPKLPWIDQPHEVLWTVPTADQVRDRVRARTTA